MALLLLALQNLQEATIQRWSTSAVDVRSELPTPTVLQLPLITAVIVSCAYPQDLQEATIQRLRRWSTSAADMRSVLPTLTLGCGAVAVLLCRSDLAPPGHNHRLTGAVARAAPQHCGMCCANRDKMMIDARGLLVHGGELFLQTWQVAAEEFGCSAESIGLAVPHQVSKKVHAQGMQMTGIAADKVVATYPQLGNVASVSLGIALSVAVREGRVRPGMRVALMAIGSGINCIMAEVMW
jgi:3-oxoacyl-[acyl-carrier-protein] synthase-3